MKVNQLKIGSILSYAQMALSVLIGLVYTPIMLRLLGQSEYGLYNTVASTVSMLAVLNLGFSSSYIRYFSNYKTQNNTNAIYRLNGLFIIIFSIIGAVALLCGLFLSFNLEFVFDEGLTASEYGTARILMLLLTINLATSFPMSVFSNIISAHEKFVFLKLLGMLKTVGGPLVTLPLLLIGFRSVAMVVSTLLISLITDIAYLIYVKRVLRQRFFFSGWEKGILKDLFVFTMFIAINTIAYYINNNVAKMFLGRFKGTDAVAVYSVGFVLYHYYMQFSTAISSVFTPRVYSIVNRTQSNILEQRTCLTELFVKVGRIQYLLLALIATGVVFFGKSFILIWAGEGYEDAYIVAVLLIIASTFDLIQNVAIEIQRAQNNHRFRSAVYAITTVFNFVITWWLCKLFGVIGAAVGLAIYFVVSYGLIMNIYYHKKCNIDIISFWKSIGRLSIGLIPPIIIGVILNCGVKVDNLLILIVEIVVYTGAYCMSMWFIGMNEYEKKLVSKPLKAIFGKLMHK